MKGMLIDPERDLNEGDDLIDDRGIIQQIHGIGNDTDQCKKECHRLKSDAFNL